MQGNMLIKVCGMRDAKNISELSRLDVNLMGLIFYPKSPRFVSLVPSRAGIIPDYTREQLREARKQMSNTAEKNVPEDTERKIKRVGVFVDEMPQSIITRVYNFNLDYIQLHGHEEPLLIDNLRRTLDPDIHKGIKFIKAISVSSVDDIATYKQYEGKADLFLFDTKCKTVGGSGEQFDWSVLDAYDGNTPFLLSGGIGPEDVERVKAFNHPKCIGIDLNSRFETSPAVKDIESLRGFVEAVRGL